VESNIVYVVIISDQDSEITQVHSVYSNKSAADNTQQKLESQLGEEEDIVVYVEQHEVFDN
jgi:hypothetical protein